MRDKLCVTLIGFISVVIPFTSYAADNIFSATEPSRLVVDMGQKCVMSVKDYFKGHLASGMPLYYGPFYGRGIMQLTWAGNFEAYGKYRIIPDNNDGSYIERLPGAAHRITAKSHHDSPNPNDGGQLMLWFPRCDPDIIVENAEYSCDSGGFYWVSKSFSQGVNISRVADKDCSAADIGLINRLVNGGGNGYHERQAYSVYILKILGDGVDVREAILISPPHPKSAIVASMLRPE
jgi:hypothetical protein